MKKIIVFLLFISFIACENNSNNDSSNESSIENPAKGSLLKIENRELEKVSNESNENSNQINKKIIKTGNISFKSKNLNDTKQKIDILVKKVNGYYSSESFNKSDYRNDYNLDIRIPSDNFDNFIKGLNSLEGNITSQNFSANDVTSEYLDFDMRLSNKTAYLEKYKDILKQARTISEILEVEDKIRVIEEEIESVKGRLKYLSDQVSLSTLNLNIYQEFDSPEKPANSFFERLWSSFVKGWKALAEFVLLLIVLWPFFIIGIVVFFIFYKWVKKPIKRDL